MSEERGRLNTVTCFLFLKSAESKTLLHRLLEVIEGSRRSVDEAERRFNATGQKLVDILSTIHPRILNMRRLHRRPRVGLR